MQKEVKIHSNIDKFFYEGQTLYIQGWIFAENSNLRDVSLKIENNEQVLKEKVNYGLERMDVYEAFQNANAKYSGFVSNIYIRTNEELKIYLSYEVNDIIEQQFIGDIKNTLSNRIKVLLSKFDKKHASDFIKYLKNGTLLDVLKEMRTTKVVQKNEVKERIDILSWIENNFMEQFELKSELYEYEIDIIIPVYNGYEYFEKLFSSIDKTKMKYRLIIVNDKSPDEKVLSYLENYACGRKNVLLLQNEENLGFVKSVNKALECTKNHVAIVNTDVEVPDSWLERLMYPIIFKERTASSTPYTNSGTICSFPDFCENNAIFEGMTVNEIDAKFEHIKPRYISMPTGVGFCMGMNKEVIQKIGFLDDVTFEKGYGEENDWCQRAIQAGYKNVQVENLFVYHKHGGSFLSEEKKRLIEKNGKELLRKHPSYNEDVAEFIEKDYNSDIREYVKLELLLENNKSKGTMVFTHNTGGGASRYIGEKIQDGLNEGILYFVIKYLTELKKYEVEFLVKQYRVIYHIKSINNISSLMRHLGVDLEKIIVNELVTYPDLYDTIQEVITLKESMKAELVIEGHDYYCICPTVNLLHKNGMYCEFLDIYNCNECLKNNPFLQYNEYENIEKWRESWKLLLGKADYITVYSDSTNKILKNIYPNLNQIRVTPHQVKAFAAEKVKIGKHEGINIGIPGILNYHKGIEVVKEILEETDRRDIDINIVLIGKAAANIKHKRFLETGLYDREELPKLIEKYNVDIAFISSICPETFSYTTEEMKKLGLPIIVFNMGAQAERIQHYDKGILVNEISGKSVVDAILQFMDKES